MKEIQAPDNYKFSVSDKERFFLFNHSIPAYVCSVLIRDFSSELSQEDKIYCKEIILEVALISLQPKYEYQISDGVQATILLLPNLLENFPAEKEKIKYILLMNLFSEFPAGGFFSNERFNIFPIMAIQTLWDRNFSDAQSLLFGYLLLRPRYDQLRKKFGGKILITEAMRIPKVIF